MGLVCRPPSLARLPRNEWLRTSVGIHGMSVARVSGVRVMYPDLLPVSLIFQQPRHSLTATAKAQACIFMRAMPFEGGSALSHHRFRSQSKSCGQAQSRSGRPLPKYMVKGLNTPLGWSTGGVFSTFHNSRDRWTETS